MDLFHDVYKIQKSSSYSKSDVKVQKQRCHMIAVNTSTIGMWVLSLVLFFFSFCSYASLFLFIFFFFAFACSPPDFGWGCIVWRRKKMLVASENRLVSECVVRSPLLFFLVLFSSFELIRYASRRSRGLLLM